MPMTTYDDATLEAMLRDLESDLVERKETFLGDTPTSAREAICAFANDLPDHRKAGVLFIGARNDGTTGSLAVTDALLVQLAGIREEGQITPPPTLTVSRRILRGGHVAVVIVEPSDSPPVRYRGRIHVRVGPRRSVATAQDERILNEKRRYRDRPFDIQPVHGASLADVDRVLFEREYLPAAVAPDILEQNERTYEQRLAASKMIAAVDEPTPTVLGLLVAGSDPRSFIPGAYIQFIRFAGTSLSDPVMDELAIDGTVGDMLRRIDDKLLAHNRRSVDFTHGSREVVSQPYPHAAMQQLVRNAVLHRTYEATNAPVRVHWFDDRLEITNPGGPFGVVTAENFGRPGLADYRNPNLAEALRVLGFVQRFGVGIATARRLLQENGNPPPEFGVEATFVSVTVRPSG